jgi:uncharacterized membrane protein
MENVPLPRKEKSLAGKVFRILYKTILIIILVIAAFALLLLTPPVQNFCTKKSHLMAQHKTENQSRDR